MSEDIVWRTPPEHALNQTRKTQFEAFAKALRQRPQEWAVLPGEKTTVGSARSAALNIRKGAMSAFRPKGSWDAVTEGTTIYVRYLGEPDTEGEDLQHVDVQNGRYKTSDIRAWARENGFENLPDRGPLPGNVIAAFEEAQDDPNGEESVTPG